MVQSVFYIFYLISIGFLWFITHLMKKIPDMISDKLKDERKHNLNKSLQIDEFYRKDGNLASIMMKWTKYAIDDESLKGINTPKGQRDLKDLVSKTVGYGSNRTVKLLTVMFQSVYNNHTVDDSASNFTTMVAISMIVASLKKDFTGEEINATDILKVKINDYNDYESEFKGIIKTIEDQIDSES